MKRLQQGKHAYRPSNVHSTWQGRICSDNFNRGLHSENEKGGVLVPAQDGIVAFLKAHTNPSAVSPRLPSKQCQCLSEHRSFANSKVVCQPLLFFHSSFLQAIDAMMHLHVHVRKVPQASTLSAVFASLRPVYTYDFCVESTLFGQFVRLYAYTSPKYDILMARSTFWS